MIDPERESLSAVHWRASVYARPNLRFSDLAGRMNALRAERILSSKTAAWETLAFAINALNCEPEQKLFNGVAATAIDFSTLAAAAFAKLKMKRNDWSTGIFADAGSGGPEWEHQAGFGYLARDVAFATAQKLADAGNLALQSTLHAIVAAPFGHADGDEPFFRLANEISVDSDYFGSQYGENVRRTCPELLKAFAIEYRAARGE